MPKPPRALGLVLCQAVVVDPSAAQMSLAGVFHSLRFSAWPGVCPSFTVYAALHGGEGEGTMQVRVTEMETERDVYRYQRWGAFTRGHPPIHLEVRIRNCVFPGPGRYVVSLRFDEYDLASRILIVNPEKPRP
jgi:hypothetical protein